VPSFELLAVGTELLLGQFAYTNTPFIAASCAACGLDIFATHQIGDNRLRIADAVRGALARCDGVIVTGGLGPTVDDLTKEAVCDVLGVPAVSHEPSVRAMEAVFEASGRLMRENNRKQAALPQGAIVMENPHGTAPGFIARAADGKIVACMPGVPSEMRPMLTGSLLPWLRERFALQGAIVTRVLHAIGIAESEIDHRIAALFAASENPKIAVLAHHGRCDVKLMAKAADAQSAFALIEPLEMEIRARLAGHVFGADEQSVEGEIVRRFTQRGQTIALAESCTGGLIGAALTAVPGSSRTFLGGIIAYDNSVKIQELAVHRSVLEAHGAVSSQVAAAMASGIRARLRASVALSVTGVAGPDGGSEERPVGLVWFGMASDDGVRTYRMQFKGDRNVIRTRATTHALALLLNFGEPNQTTASYSEYASSLSQEGHVS